MSSETSIGVDSRTRDELRQVAREMGAQQHHDVTIPDAIRALIAAWRQSAGRGAL